MYSILSRILIFILSGILIICCTEKKSTGEETAKKYCGSCHLFPGPFLLDKITWQKNVLPAMGKLLGAPQNNIDPFDEADRISLHLPSLVSEEDWKKIVTWYITAAPQNLPSQGRPPITKATDLFSVEGKPSVTYANNTFIKIDPGNKRIYSGNMDSLLTVYDSRLNKAGNHFVDGTLVNLFFNQPINKAGSREGVMTRIGIMNPNDFQTGSVSLFSLANGVKFSSSKIIDSLPRPVDALAHDLDKDGKTDYLVCGFGNREGSFFWMQNKGDSGYTKKILRPLPGATKAHVEDFNGDGLPDILALFAQGDEGIFLFLNKGGGEFATKEIIRFPPVYGSTYFELTDINGDGKKDILYTCGDNADYSPILKKYHGVYVFIAEGDMIFRQKYFFPLHGAFKAIAKDFDGDGDKDIAAISYFPDKKNDAAEGFVYLEQTSALSFEAHTIKEYNQGRWITMDAGDVDGDGDEDIVIGSLYLPIEISKSTEDLRGKPTFLLLRNKSIEKE